MHLQPTAASPYPVGARIARPFVPDVITTTLREGARRVIGATAKPLYAIDDKAGGLDRRTATDLPLRGRGTARRRWKEFEPVAFTPNIFFFQHIGHMKHMKHMKHTKHMRHKSRFSERRRILMGAGIATVRCICNCWLYCCCLENGGIIVCGRWDALR